MLALNNHSIHKIAPVFFVAVLCLFQIISFSRYASSDMSSSKIANSKELILRIQVVEQRVHIGDKVELNIQVENASNSPQNILMAMEPKNNLFLEIYDEKGRKIFPKPSYVSNDWVPNGKKSIFRLWPQYTHGRNILVENFNYKFQNPGKYYLYAIYNVPDFSGKVGVKHWTGWIKSRKAMITILPPALK